MVRKNSSSGLRPAAPTGRSPPPSPPSPSALASIAANSRLWNSAASSGPICCILAAASSNPGSAPPASASTSCNMPTRSAGSNATSPPSAPALGGGWRKGFSSPSGIWRLTTSEKSDTARCAYALEEDAGNVSALMAAKSAAHSPSEVMGEVGASAAATARAAPRSSQARVRSGRQSRWCRSPNTAYKCSKLRLLTSLRAWAKCGCVRTPAQRGSEATAELSRRSRSAVIAAGCVSNAPRSASSASASAERASSADCCRSTPPPTAIAAGCWLC
mmetsp:Transcript_14532/g.35519  ORF Transcript_14532/g.35519 Transcript_14532/m.35519 type:complete len:274 (+) Transcript_14532:506-1327(+)